MRTTLDLEDGLARAAKKRAVEEGTTLTALIEAALREYLAPRGAPARPVRLRLLTGVDLADRDSLYDRMEGRG
jgi:hypothetical protein